MGDTEIYRVKAEGAGRVGGCGERGRFIYLLSQAVYGTRRPPPWSEAHPPDPDTTYGYSTWIGELLTLRADIPPAVVLRLARVYGLSEGLKWDSMPHRFAQRAARGEAIDVLGEGDDLLDLVHVQDVCDAVVKACTASLPPSTVLNIGSGRPVSVTEVATTCHEIASRLPLNVPLQRR